MTDETTIGIILRTKLHRPLAPIDYVHRPRLSEYLDQQLEQPIALVSAPAGYGKSTLVSCWLDKCDRPNAWISLDENDNDLRQFLSYFLAAVETVFPNSVKETMTLVNAPTLPPLSTLVGTLANELDLIEQDFILVMDDIHTIQEKSVYYLLNDLLRHPPRPMLMVLIGRRDPLLNIAALRAQSQLAEIRLQDLRFTAAETAAYMQQIMKKQITDDIAIAWSEKTEGWVTGLRLAVLSIQQRGDFKTLPLELKKGNLYVMEYLFNEVFSHQSPDFLDYLLKTSILDRFCAPLCDAIIGTGVEPGNLQNGSWQFVAQLKKENLFLINLDAEGKWFRYHHLFQDLLKRQLQRNYSADDIKSLHAKASEWFKFEGLITESITHALAAKDHVRAAEIVERYRDNEFNADRWYNVERWLAKLPDEIKSQRPGLLLTEAWVAFFRHRLEQIPNILDNLESLLDDQDVGPAFMGEVDFFRAYLYYWEGEGEKSRQLFESALQQIPGNQQLILGETELHFAMALCMIGQKELAVMELTDRIHNAHPTNFVYLTRLHGGLVFAHLFDGDLHQAGLDVLRMQELTAKGRIRNSDAWASYLRASVYLNGHDLASAANHFVLAAEDRYVLETRAAIDALAGLALAQQLSQQPDEAAESAALMLEFARELNDTDCLSIAQSLKARISLLQGDLAPASRWAQSFQPAPASAELFLWLEIPVITRLRVMVSVGSKASLREAADSLAVIRKQSETLRYICQTIEIAVLQALGLERQGRTDEALDALKEAVAMAEPGGWIRPFVEAGSPMVDLLMRLRKQDVFVDYINRILAAFTDTESKPPLTDLGATNDEREFEAETVTPIQNLKSKIQNSLIEPLTNRELDVLELLAQRLQNKEIAEKLFVSPSTVKSHLRNIYQKLNVSKRSEAVEKATELGILFRR